MLTAHYRQAWTLERRVHETESLYDGIDQLVAHHGLPTRAVGALADAARGRRLRRTIYMNLVDMTSGEPISELTASRDLKAMVDAGVLVPKGEGRGRIYLGSQELRQQWLDVRATRPPKAHDDPYVTRSQTVLPGLR